MKSFISIIACALGGFLLSPPSLAQGPPTNSAEADFAQLSHYREANLQMSLSGTKIKVVFLGDSVTERWGSLSGKWFADPGWVNRGIGGQTSSQLLLRERDDALNLHPSAIVLEAGSNDMRLGFTPEAIRDHFLTMGELAQAHHIAIFVTTMTPTCDCFRPLSGLRTVSRIHDLNRLLAAMCLERHWTLIDINTPLANASGYMRKELTVEGVHPNDAGYALIAPPIERALHAYRLKKP
ncbi:MULTISPECIES: GDSL-type esterase/lipase family protein [Acidobacteriaceae]|uniref:GDSL-type esterase/lipase family protein n=1 Tax=Acidobacteriaceae TaxID=204434 RepID=UPI00131B0F4C|nr:MULTISPECIES: GDSL-type esterase/lipase family protein [Acidobacteriaceae]MDW5266242.1 GDSL-type esterase/lipase family protein [Edaphobacter sp.]